MLFSEQTIIYKNLKIIPDQRYIFQDGKEINLSRLEFDTLLYLLHNINRVLSKEQIYEAVWKHETDDYINAVTCVIYKLRQKIDVRGKVILQPHGKEFFTWYSKHLLHCTVSTFLHDTVSSFLQPMARTSFYPLWQVLSQEEVSIGLLLVYW